MRELSTRYGRHNLGFLWLLGEPIIFAAGVSIIWSIIRPEYENGIKIVPFVVSGYMPIILVRHVVGHSVGAVRNNNALLFHSVVSPLHLVSTRVFVEFVGVTLSAVVIIALYNVIGIMELPPQFSDLSYLYAGWFLLGWLSGSLALNLCAIAEIFEFVEKFVQIITYIAIPISGAFLMAASMPPKFRAVSMAVPLIHEFELIRRGYFGASVYAIYNVPYVIAWCAGLTISGLLLLQFVREHVEVE